MLFRPTETPGRFWYALSGNVDYEAVLAGGDEAVLKGIRDCIERTDLEFGKVFYISDFQCVLRNWSMTCAMLMTNS